MPSRSGRPAQKRGSKRNDKPYPASRPLGDSARANRKSSASPSPVSVPSSSGPSVRKLNSGERPVRRDLGMPSREEYAVVEAEYLDALDHRKKGKALISQEMFDNIWLALHRPTDHSIETPQFRWWVRKMFRLEARGGTGGPALPEDLEYVDRAESIMVVIHDGKRVAVKEHIYDILCFCHARVDHAGRDKTAAEIRKRYTWVPKELIAGFVRKCPTCICKRTGKYDEERVIKVEHDPASEMGTRLAEVYAQDEPAESTAQAQSDQDTAVYAQVPSPPLRNLDLGPAFASSLTYSQNTGNQASGLDPLLRSLPALVPWYMSSAGPSGSGSGYGLSPGSSSGNPPPLLPHWHISPVDVSYQRTLYDQHVRLPSIHTCGRAHQQPGHGSKVTLPSLAQLLASDAPAIGQTLSRHPLEALPGNDSAFSQPEPPHMHYAGPLHGSTQAHVPYVPQIDPLLLQDGVHMLATAAEAAHMRRTLEEGDYRQVE
ncbi:hypothetical protein BV20DRAFT_233012 [Pilatotrama ljubarskyi]|nr:hypothetical protein BV20DRAFT_233012 [Pilatotrama ljubarskyi]